MKTITYNKKGQQIEFDVTLKDYTDLANSNEFFYHLVSYNNNRIYKNGLTFLEYMYGILYAFDNFKDDLDSNTLKLIENIKIGFINKIDSIGSRSIKINEELENEVYHGISPKYNKLERLIYIYYKLCLILEMDEDYFKMIYMSSEGIFPRTRERIKNITLENNKVVCYELVEILNYFARKEGLEYEDLQFYGGYEHATSKIGIEKTLLEFDPISTVGDMVNIKIGYFPEGINVNVGQLEDVFFTCRKIEEDIKKEKPRYLKQNNLISKNTLELIYDLNIDEKQKKYLLCYLTAIKALPIKDADLNNYIIMKLPKAFKKSFDDKINLTMILTNIDSLEFSYVISLIDNDNNKKFLLFDKDIYMCLSEDEIVKLVEMGKIFFIKTTKGIHYIPNIDNKKQNINRLEIDKCIETLRKKVENDNDIEKGKNRIKTN